MAETLNRRGFIKALAATGIVATAGAGSMAAMPVTVAADNGPLIPCDGRLLDCKAYADLFRVIGLAYGDRDDETNFAIPDWSFPEQQDCEISGAVMRIQTVILAAPVGPLLTGSLLNVWAPVAG